MTTSNNNYSPPPRQFLQDKIFFKNSSGKSKNWQIIEFELRTPGRTCNPKTGYF